jgi:hypothetical protein
MISGKENAHEDYVQDFKKMTESLQTRSAGDLMNEATTAMNEAKDSLEKAKKALNNVVGIQGQKDEKPRVDFMQKATNVMADLVDINPEKIKNEPDVMSAWMV